MLIFIYFIFFIDFLMLHFTLELFVLLVYGSFLNIFIFFLNRFFSDLDIFEFESKEDEANSRFLLLGILHYNLLNIRLFTNTLFIIKFVDKLVSSICKDLKDNNFNEKLKLLHNIYKVEDINNYIDEIYKLKREQDKFI